MYNKNEPTTLTDLADCIRRLRYPDMRSLGSELYPIITVVKSDVAVSDTLHVWAEKKLQEEADKLVRFEHGLVESSKP